MFFYKAVPEPDEKATKKQSELLTNAADLQNEDFGAVPPEAEYQGVESRATLEGGKIKVERYCVGE